ncbi:hypothetical protein Q8F55_002693 [Vanrija albida]|uniref:Uncharacterized protein n=1 Tax=Vanrija albida TaxID=181172 RepID=A0ABR3QB30_9TREE
MSHQVSPDTISQGTAPTGSALPAFGNPRLQKLFCASRFTRLEFQFAVAEVGRSVPTKANHLRVVVLDLLRAGAPANDEDDEALLAGSHLGRIPQSQLKDGLEDFKLVFQRPYVNDKEGRGQKSLVSDYALVQTTLQDLGEVFGTASPDMFHAFLSNWVSAPQHPRVRGDNGRFVRDTLLDAWAGVTRLCVGASQPRGGSTTNQLTLLVDRYFSDRVELESSDLIPPYNPARKAWHQNEAEWRYHDGLITDEVAKMVSKTANDIPLTKPRWPTPSSPPNLLTEGGLVHQLFKEMGLDVNEMRVGPRRSTDKSTNVNFATCVGLIKNAGNTWTEIESAFWEGRPPRVILPCTSPSPRIHPEADGCEAILSWNSFPSAFTSLASAFASLPADLQRLRRVGNVWEALQGIGVEVWNIPCAGPARLYIDQLAESYRKDITPQVLRTVQAHAEGDAQLNWWDLMSAGGRDVEIHRTEVMDLPTRDDLDLADEEAWRYSDTWLTGAVVQMFPFAIKALASAWSDLSDDLQTTRKSGLVWQALQGIEFDIWDIPRARRARLYIDHPTASYRQDIAPSVLLAVQKQVDANDEINWWDILQAGVVDPKSTATRL